MIKFFTDLYKFQLHSSNSDFETIEQFQHILFNIMRGGGYYRQISRNKRKNINLKKIPEKKLGKKQRKTKYKSYLFL